MHEWKLFLDNLQDDDPVKFSAIKVCKLQKKDENKILIKVPSEAAKSEFETVRKDFYLYFSGKSIIFILKVNMWRMKLCKKKSLPNENYLINLQKKNPILKELDDLMKFDFS